MSMNLCTRCNKNPVPFVGVICSMCIGTPMGFHEVKKEMEPTTLISFQEAHIALELWQKRETEKVRQLREVIKELRATIKAISPTLWSHPDHHDERTEASELAKKALADSEKYESE